MLAGAALIFLSEEMTFWLLVAVVEHILPTGYYSIDMIGSQADQRVVRDLLSERYPKLFAHLDKHNLDVGIVTFSWSVC